MHISNWSAKGANTLYRSRSSRSLWIAPPAVLARSSFVAVDFETANTNRESACQIAMVRIDGGRVVERFSTLLAPPQGFDEFEFTYIHGIKPNDVRHAPTWEQIASKVANFSGGLPVFAHNAPFDSGVWNGLDGFFNTTTLPTDFYCSYRTARQLVPGLVNYKLPTVTAHLVPGFNLNHHSADSDAEACGLIVAALQRIS